MKSFPSAISDEDDADVSRTSAQILTDKREQIKGLEQFVVI